MLLPGSQKCVSQECQSHGKITAGVFFRIDRQILPSIVDARANFRGCDRFSNEGHLVKYTGKRS